MTGRSQSSTTQSARFDTLNSVSLVLGYGSIQALLENLEKKWHVPNQ